VGGGSIVLAALLALAAPASTGGAPLAPREPELAPAEGEVEGLPLPAPLLPEAEAEERERPAPAAAPEGWVDVSHEAVARGVFDVVEWFDRFFADDRRLEVGRSESFMSLQGALKFSSTGRVTPGYGIRLSATLPRLGSWLGRLRLVITGVTPETQTPTSADPGSAPRAPGQTSPQASVEIRYDLVRARRTVVDLGTGILLGWPPHVFGRARLTHVEPLWEGALARLTPAAFWVAGETGFGTATQVDLEQQLAAADRLRVSQAIGITQASAGWEGGTELVLYHALSPTSALLFSASWLGATQPYPYAKLYRLAVRLRRDFWRKWLFFQLEPEVTWPKDPGLPRRREEALIFRLEVHFDSTSVALE
jgi:hypothetical protein